LRIHWAFRFGCGDCGNRFETPTQKHHPNIDCQSHPPDGRLMTSSTVVAGSQMVMMDDDNNENDEDEDEDFNFSW
jgi:transcription elongation factor Elf1